MQQILKFRTRKRNEMDRIFCRDGIYFYSAMNTVIFITVEWFMFFLDILIRK